MATSKQTNIDNNFMKEILSRYDNTEYAGRNVEDIDIPDDAADVMCNMYLSELNVKTPHIVFAEIISRAEGNKMRTHVMSLDVLKYYLKDPNAIFTNWVINDDSSSFSQLYYSNQSGDAVKLKKGNNQSEDTPEYELGDILGDRQLFMDSLDTGMGGIHGERRFFQLCLSTGNYLIDPVSALKLYTIDKSIIFILRERIVELVSVEGALSIDSKLMQTIDTTRSAGIGSNVSTISGTHGQAPPKIIYELIEYNDGDSGRIFNRPGDESLFFKETERYENDLKLIEHHFKTYKWGYEKDDKGYDQNSYKEDIIELTNDIDNNYNEDVFAALPIEDSEKFYKMKNKLIEEVEFMKINLKELAIGKWTDIEEKQDPIKNNRFKDFGFIFSEKLNTTNKIVLDSWFGNKEINEPKLTDHVIIYADLIPKHRNLYDTSHYKNFINMIIEDEDGKQKSICGKIVRIFSNLTSNIDEDQPSHHTRGQWIYHINLLGGKSIIVSEARVEVITDENGKKTEKIIQQIVTDEPKPLKKGQAISDFTIQLISRLDAISKCNADVIDISEMVINNNKSLYIHELSEDAFDFLLPYGNVLEVQSGTDALRIENELSNELDNSFSDDGDDVSQYLRENYPPHPIIPDDRPVLIQGETMTISEAINRSPDNSPARQVQARNESFRQAIISPFPMFPGPLSSPVMSNSARALRVLTRGDETTSLDTLSASSESSGSRSLFSDDEELEPRPSEELEPRPSEELRRRTAVGNRARGRLNELTNANNAINSINSSDNYSGNRRRGLFQENERNVTPRLSRGMSSDFVHASPSRTGMRDLGPLVAPETPSRTGTGDLSPQVVPDASESQMGNLAYYTRQTTPDYSNMSSDDDVEEESKED